MNIPDEIRKCVVFVGYKNVDGVHCFAGTAFFVGRSIEGTDKGFIYLITAKHVIDGIRDKGATQVCIRVNLKDKGALWIETPIEKWLFHPNELATDVVDVAVFQTRVFPELDHRILDHTNFVTDEFVEGNVKVGLEIFLAGLFSNHSGERRNIPVLRVGNIIAMPEEQVTTGMGLMDAYLVEARSLGGISGSPVFVRFQGLVTEQAPKGAAIGLRDSFSLLGLMHGHWSMSYGNESDTAIKDIQGEREVNMGIAIVVPASKILEVMEQPIIQEKEKRAMAELRAHLKKQNVAQDSETTPK